MHDLGLAAWFGGSLMGAVGLNGAANDVSDPSDRSRVASAGWARWTPVNAVAIGVHAVGGAALIRANKGRVLAHGPSQANTAVKTILTGAAMAATAYSGWQGAQVAKAGKVPAEGGAVPAAHTPRTWRQPSNGYGSPNGSRRHSPECSSSSEPNRASSSVPPRCSVTS